MIIVMTLPVGLQKTGIIMPDFLWRALVGGILVAAVAGPYGCFVVWRRMAYFGDTLAHASLLGVVLGYLLHINVLIGIIVTSLSIAFFLGIAGRSRRLGNDTILGILAHSSLALGLVLASLAGNLRIDLLGYLFGDILGVTWGEIAWLAGGGGGALLALAFLWRRLLSICIHPELARIEGVSVERVQVGFLLLLAITVSLALKLVGIILVSALLIIPAATIRRWMTSPEQMAAGAMGVGMVSVILGLAGSYYWDTPSGPSVVVALAGLFVLSNAVPQPVKASG